MGFIAHGNRHHFYNLHPKITKWVQPFWLGYFRPPKTCVCLRCLFTYSTIGKPAWISPPFERICFTCFKHLKQIQVDHDTIHLPKLQVLVIHPQSLTRSLPLTTNFCIQPLYLSLNPGTLNKSYYLMVVSIGWLKSSHRKWHFVVPLTLPKTCTCQDYEKNATFGRRAGLRCSRRWVGWPAVKSARFLRKHFW